MIEDFIISPYLDNWTKKHKWAGQQENGSWYLYTTIPKPYQTENGWFSPQGTVVLWAGKSSYLGHFLLELNYD